jgi:hypothetical protein
VINEYPSPIIRGGVAAVAPAHAARIAAAPAAAAAAGVVAATAAAAVVICRIVGAVSGDARAVAQHAPDRGRSVDVGGYGQAEQLLRGGERW